MRTRIGISAVGIIAALVVVLALAGVVAYFTSDVFRTKAKGAYDQFAHWTPENIAKHPLDYLNFCEEQTKQALEKLKASEIAIAQKKAKLESLRDDTRNKLDLGRKALDELKELYRKADADSSWPATWRAMELQQDQAKRQVMKFAGEILSKDGLLKRYESAVSQLNVQTNKVQEARDKAKEQLAKIDTNREMLKVQQITDDLKNSLVAMKGVIETTVVGVAGAEPGTLSLEDLAAQSETTIDESEFAKIMAQ